MKCKNCLHDFDDHDTNSSEADGSCQVQIVLDHDDNSNECVSCPCVGFEPLKVSE